MSTWDRSNPYEGPEPCECGHDYGRHCGGNTNECLVRTCDCREYVLAQDGLCCAADGWPGITHAKDCRSQEGAV